MASLVVEDSDAPPELELPEVPLSLDFHPSADVLALGLVDGSVHVSRFAKEGHEAPFISARPFQEGAGGCRSVRFSGDGQSLFCGSADHSIMALSPAGTVLWSVPDAHRDPVSCLSVVSETVLASGDDSGAVKLWDVRAPARPALAFDVFQDYVSECLADAEFHPENLLATSGDGTLACFDLRAAGSVLGRSNELEEDLLSVAVIKGGKKVVCGTSEGVLLVFSWDNWDGATDSFPGHPESVGALLKLDEQTVLTGSSDGLIRVVGVQPSKLYGVVGDHGGFPLERMRWSADRSLIGSLSHDAVVRFWDVSYLHEDDDDEEEEAGGAAEDLGEGAGGDHTSPELLASLRGRAGGGGGGGDGDRWEDESDGSDGMSNSDDSDDSDDEGRASGGGGGGGRGGKKGGAQYQTPAQSFFKDL